MTTIHPPIYLLTTQSRCWRCGQDQPVVAIAGTGRNRAEELIKVQYVREMPDDLLGQVLARHANYRLHLSRSTKTEYYTNMCQCGGNYGDFFLHSEPGDGGFFPTMPSEAELITIEKLPTTDSAEIESGAHGSLSPLVMEYGIRIDPGGPHDD